MMVAKACNFVSQMKKAVLCWGLHTQIYHLGHELMISGRLHPNSLERHSNTILGVVVPKESQCLTSLLKWVTMAAE